MSDEQAADAAETTETETETISRAEAQKAFKARDAAKAELRELRAELAKRDQSAADAEKLKAEQDGDYKKQLELAEKARAELTDQLAALTSEHTGLQGQIRASKIEAAVMADVQGDREVAAELLANILGQLDDGTGEIEDIAKDASEKLKRYAPHLFKAAPQPTRGFMPTDQHKQLGLTRSDTAAQYAAIHGRPGGKKLI